MAALTIITVLSGFQRHQFHKLCGALSSHICCGCWNTFSFYRTEKTTIRSFAPNIGFQKLALVSHPVHLIQHSHILCHTGAVGSQGKSRKVILRGAVLERAWSWNRSYSAIFSIQHHFVLCLSGSTHDLYRGKGVPIVQIIYGIVLLAEIYTTAVGNLYGFSARMTVSGRSDPGYVIIISALCAFLTGLLGFSNLVRYLYPSVGYAGIIILICLVINRKNKKYLDKR